MKKQSQLTNQIKKLQYQLSYSEHVNKELSHYLAELYRRTGTPPDKLPSLSNLNTGNVQILNGANIQNHLQELYYVQPLIMCYEQTLYFLKEELSDLREHNEEIVEQVDNVTKQNQFLRKQLNIKLSLLAKSQNVGVDVGFLRVEKQNLVEIRGILENKIELLSKKVKELERELDGTNREKLKLITPSDLHTVKDAHEAQMKQLETKIIDLESQNKRLKNQVDNEKVLLKEQTQKRQNLQQNIALLKNQLKLSKQNYQKYVSTKQKASQTMESELQILKDQLKSSIKKEHQLFNKAMNLQSELQDKTNRINNLNLQNTQYQSNSNNMLQMLQSYETKVSALNNKIKKLESEIKSNGEDHSDLIKKSQILEWKLTEKEEQISRKEQEWRKQKQRLGKMWQQRIEALRKGMNMAQHD